MEHRKHGSLSSSFGLCWVFFSSFFQLLLTFSGPASAYKNYTVGDTLGWYDNTEKSSVNYQKWAESKNFSLGDFLIFNTDTNHTVVQTYNYTTYKLCDYEDSLDKDTIQWSSADPSNTATRPVTVAVPLLKEGPAYFFSGDYDGDQCKSGQHFSINVTHGQGLPPSLKGPSEDDAPAPNSPDFNNGDSAPDTIVPSNFDHPQDASDDDVKDDSGAYSLQAKLLSGILVLFGTCLLS